MLTLLNFPASATFNIITFGFSTEELFYQSQPVTKQNIQLAVQYINDLEADWGFFFFFLFFVFFSPSKC